jgi:hypothetical protein
VVGILNTQSSRYYRLTADNGVDAIKLAKETRGKINMLLSKNGSSFFVEVPPMISFLAFILSQARAWPHANR